MTTKALYTAILTCVLAAGISGVANATLIGDTIIFECTNCGPPTNDSFVVTEGAGAELTLFQQFQVDVEASSLLITWIFTSSAVFDVNFRWSDLDFFGAPGGVVDVAIDDSSTWSTDGDIVFGSDFVEFANNGDSSVASGDFLLLNIDVNQVPEPGTFSLTLLGMAGLIGLRRSSKR